MKLWLSNRAQWVYKTDSPFPKPGDFLVSIEAGEMRVFVDARQRKNMQFKLRTLGEKKAHWCSAFRWRHASPLEMFGGVA